MARLSSYSASLLRKTARLLGIRRMLHLAAFCLKTIGAQAGSKTLLRGRHTRESLGFLHLHSLVAGPGSHLKSDFLLQLAGAMLQQMPTVTRKHLIATDGCPAFLRH